MLINTKSNSHNASDKWGVYLHIPYCKSKCAYCSFVSGCDFSDMDDYVSALISEIRKRGGRAADTVYIGGGTPSVLKRGMIERIMRAVNENFDVSPGSEISIECNPDSAKSEFFEECAAAGINRVSIGLQSASDKLLKIVGRPHTFEDFRTALGAAKAAGFENINADLMLNLPGQELRDTESSLKILIDLGIPHISVYGLAVEEGTPLFESGYRPDEDRGANMYERTAEILREYGYLRYEVSNFALPGHECRHNLKYWERVPYVGLGLAAHSFDGRVRSENTTDIKEYIAGRTVQAETELTSADEIEESIMLSLRTAKGLDCEKLRIKYGYDILADKAAALARLAELGLIETDRKTIKLTDKAYYIMNSVIVSLL